MVRARSLALLPPSGPSHYPALMPPADPSPLERALDHLADLLPTREAARRWYERVLERIGPEVAIDSWHRGALTEVHRRDAESGDVLPLPLMKWTAYRTIDARLEGFDLHDGMQSIRLLYAPGGGVRERAGHETPEGRLGNLADVIAQADDAFDASARFVASLDGSRAGPIRVHYPQPCPGGVQAVVNIALPSARRALFAGWMDSQSRVNAVVASERVMVVDGFAGTAIGVGATRDEAVLAFYAELDHGLPEPRVAAGVDEQGRLLHEPVVPEGFEGVLLPGDSAGFISPPIPNPAFQGESWKRGTEPGFDPDATPPALPAIHGWAPISDHPAVPRRAACVPYVVIPLEPSPEPPPPRGRWWRILGASGATCHAVLIEEPHGFTLVGGDLLNRVSLTGLRATLDRLEADDPDVPPPTTGSLTKGAPFRGRAFGWRSATPERPAGLFPYRAIHATDFDPAALDGDQLRAIVYRHRVTKRDA